ncbi:hypothetical protein C6361_28010 [Plantactinospora sp. BC1]|uniref:GmrSD restriction endonuclease domain-containing protein n=1 Tax=Plantactinospora sp. BC1 TaxID=2108470 RepID=UPI000D15B4D4|nr:DUF262 domain-containing protein [Plantactinospora sp. BC1]AVT32672.1 hypothetical protein C6361_28010 [Plantactinospora sp. BC1]
MPVDKTSKQVVVLVSQISSGEIKLPEIQRGYVWKPTQVAKFVESLYRGYPSGALLFWKTTDKPRTRDVAADAPTLQPAAEPLYLLDGQQRLTSLHRVFNDHPEAQIVFNVEKETFQNQSAATKKDPRWVKVYDILNHDDLLELRSELLAAGVKVDSKELGQRLKRIEAIEQYWYHLEILTGFSYEDVADIFVRVNSGRALKTLDLALATLSARWSGILAKLEAEADHWVKQGYAGLDVVFLSRAFAGAVLGRGLSAHSHARLVEASDEQLERGWETVKRGLKHLVPLLQHNLNVSRSSLLPSLVALIPIVIYLGERDDEALDQDTANGLLYWLLAAYVRNRYSGSTDTVLGQDIPAVRDADPVRRLLRNLGVHSRLVVTPDALAGRSRESPYFFLSFLACQRNGAHDWWHGTAIAPGLDGAQKLEYHHIHPVATLRDAYSKADINDLANLAFISAKANKKISDKSPSAYFSSLGEAELRAHLVPLDVRLRESSTYPEFLAARRNLLAAAMTDLLDTVRPKWLVDTQSPQPDPIDGLALEMTLYQSAWEAGRLLLSARGPGVTWSGAVALPELEAALAQAADGIDGDVEIAGETIPVRVLEDAIEVQFGPFMVVGTSEQWTEVLARERADARTLSQCPVVPVVPWTGETMRLPVTSTD